MSGYVQIEDALNKTCPFLGSNCVVSECMFWVPDPYGNMKLTDVTVQSFLEKHELDSEDVSNIKKLTAEILGNIKKYEAIKELKDLLGSLWKSGKVTNFTSVNEYKNENDNCVYLTVTSNQINTKGRCSIFNFILNNTNDPR